MSCFQFLFCLSVLVLNHSVHGKKLCNITDIECVTKQAQKVYDIYVPGIKGLIEPSDPLYLEEVEGVLPRLTYRLSNLTLTGLQQCQVIQLRINNEDLIYQYDMQCPHLVLNYHHKAKGFLDTVEIDTDGLSTVTFDDYIMKISGRYEKFISEKDQKLHYHLHGFTLETELRGNLTCDSHSPLHSDKIKSDLARAYINQNSKEMEKYVKSPTMEKFVAMLLNNLNVYLRNFVFEIQLPASTNDV